MGLLEDWLKLLRNQKEICCVFCFNSLDSFYKDGGIVNSVENVATKQRPG